MFALKRVSLLKFLFETRRAGQANPSEPPLKLVEFSDLKLVSGGGKQPVLPTPQSPGGSWL